MSGLPRVISALEQLESECEADFVAATRAGVDGDDLPYFVYFDRNHDIYRSGFINTLVGEFAEATRLVGDDELGFVAGLLRRVDHGDYHVNHADVFWVRAIHARGGMSLPLDPNSRKPLSESTVSFLMKAPLIHRQGTSPIQDGVWIKGQIGDGQWAEYPARLELDGRRVEVGEGRVLR